MSLVAVFIPLLFMTGVVGRLFKEFAVTLSVAVIVSAIVSLTLTPMMCGRLLRPAADEHPGAIARASLLFVVYLYRAVFGGQESYGASPYGLFATALLGHLPAQYRSNGALAAILNNAQVEFDAAAAIHAARKTAMIFLMMRTSVHDPTHFATISKRCPYGRP